MTMINPKQIRDLFLAVHPVGSIYMTTDSTNPHEKYGGTWVAWGSGRVPVGVNASDSSFNTVEKIGGAKTHALSTGEMPNHAHTVYGFSASGTKKRHIALDNARRW